MGVHKVQRSNNPFSDKADEVVGQNSKTMSTFESQATGNTFGRQSDSIFGTFPRQNDEENEKRNTGSAFGGTCSGTQATFGSSSFQNRGYFQKPLNFGFGQSKLHQVTEICFTGFGEAKTNYNFNNIRSAGVREIVLAFKNPDKESFFSKPDIFVIIKSQLTQNTSNWTSNGNDFSFSVGNLERYNSSFVMKSTWPTKFSVTVSSGAIINNRRIYGSSSKKSGNRKITMTFPSDRPYFTFWNDSQKPLPSTVVEIPIKDDLELSNEMFSFSVGPSTALNSFEVETSESSAFKVTFSENEKQGFGTSRFGNRSTLNGPVFFNQGRQLNDFPSSSGFLFGQPTPAFDSYNTAFGSSPKFGSTHPFGSNQSNTHLTGGFNNFSFHQDQPINPIPTTNNSLFGQSGNTSFQPTGFKQPRIFGQRPSFYSGGSFGQGQQLFGNENRGSKAFDFSLEQPNNQANSLFSHPNNKDCSDKVGTLFSANSRPTTGQHTIANENSRACGFGATHSFGNSKTPTHTEFSGKYQPTIGSDLYANASSPIQTKMHSITAMNEYLNNSFEEIRLQRYKEDCMRSQQQRNMANPHRYNQESTFWGYNPSHNAIGNINGSTTNQPVVAGVANANCTKSNHVSNKDHFSNDDKNVKIRKPRHVRRPKESKSANEFYEDVFKYMDYIRKQYGHLETSRNYKNENNASEHNSKEYATPKSDEAIKTWNQHGEKSSMPTFGGSTWTAVKTKWVENQCPIAAQSNSGETPNDPRGFGTASSNKIAKTIESSLTCMPLDEADANFGQVPLTPERQHNLNAKPKECEQPELVNTFGCVGEKSTGILPSTASNNKASQVVFFPMFSHKDSGDLDDSNATKSGLSPSSSRFSIFKGPFLSQTAFNNKPDALFTKCSIFSNPFDPKERKNSEKDANDVSDSGGLKITGVEDSLQSAESKDKEAKGAEKHNSVLLQDVPMYEHECLGLTNQPTNSQAFKMKKISEELAALVVDGCENDSKRKDSDADSDISNFSIISNQSLNADGKPKEHPTGIVMTRSGYYTVPSLEDLKSLMTEDGRCTVPNFKIGRKGYGSIMFNKEINVAGLNVDKIVHFRNKEIIIYPNQKDQSFVEAVLNNCEALITLEQVWPHDKTKHEPMKDPERLDEMKYEDKLRLVCDKNDIHFVEYLPETGRWVFKMKQFVKNSINCWDEEDDAPETLNKSTEPSAEIKQLKETIIMTDTETECFGKP